MDLSPQFLDVAYFLVTIVGDITVLLLAVLLTISFVDGLLLAVQVVRA